MAKHTNTASKPNVAWTGICSSSEYGATTVCHRATGNSAMIMNRPPMIVSGTIETMPARIADM